MRCSDTGLINANEAYSKKMILLRLGISQKFWDKMLDDGLPFTVVGHSRWVIGSALIEHFKRKAVRKNKKSSQQEVGTRSM